MENQPKLNSSKEVIAYLVEHFPRCFVAEGEARPLKVGIFQDLAERIPAEINLSKTQLRSALRLYTSSWRYLYGIKAGVQRVDLDGNACGELDAQHVEHARTQLEEAKARVAAHRVKRRADAKGDTVRQQRRPGKEVPADHAAKPRQPKPKKTDFEIHRTFQPEGRKVTDISELTVGQNIRVAAGKNAVDASILEITKDGIRVQLASGLAMIVRAEHLQF